MCTKVTIRDVGMYPHRHVGLDFGQGAHLAEMTSWTTRSREMEMSCHHLMYGHPQLIVFYSGESTSTRFPVKGDQTKRND